MNVRRILNAISGLCQEKGISKRGLAEAIGANYMAVWRALSEDVDRVDFGLVYSMARGVGIKISFEGADFSEDASPTTEKAPYEPTPEDQLDTRLWLLRAKLLALPGDQRNAILALVGV